MNIFYLSKNPSKCAEFHCDKHVVKLILEIAQMLSTAHHMENSKYKSKVYKPTHVNHPCTKWVRESKENYAWTYKFFLALCKEYTKRYKRKHVAENLKRYLEHNPCKQKGMTTRPQCMPDKYKSKNPIIAYRNYYIGEKMRFAKWNHGKLPFWVRAKNETFL